MGAAARLPLLNAPLCSQSAPPCALRPISGRVSGLAGQRIAWWISQAAAAVLCGGMAWLGWGLVQLEREAPMPFIAGVPSWIPMLALPAGFGLMALRFALAAAATPPEPRDMDP